VSALRPAFKQNRTWKHMHDLVFSLPACLGRHTITGILLFGSRARGDARPDSDYDLLIVYDGPHPHREAKLQVRRRFRLPSFSMDLFVMSSTDFARRRNVPNSMAREASENGVVCFG